MTTPHAIRTNSLAKQFGSVTAVDGIDLTVESGEAFGLLGPNGAGKSTVIDLVLGLTTPTEGRAFVFGTDMASNPKSARRRMGVLPENYDVYRGMTGRKQLRAILRLKGADDDAQRLRDEVGITAEAFDRPAGRYSKGMRQRLVLAMALAGDPDLLILDEPSSGLDPGGIRLVRDLIRERVADGTTVFFSSHRLAEVEAVCDRIGIVNDGRLVSVKDVDELTNRVGNSERLRLFTREPPDADLIDRLQTVKAVSRVDVDGQTLAVDCTTPEAKADVVELVNRTCPVRDFEMDETSLEDVFDVTVERVHSETPPTDTPVGVTGVDSE